MNAVTGLAHMQIKQVKCLGMTFYLSAGIVLLLMLRADTFVVGFALYLYEVLYLGESAAEQSKSGVLVSALPVNRRQIVQARYLYALGALTMLCALLALAGLLLRSIGAPPAYLTMLPSMFLSGCLYIALVIPPMLFWGGMTARIWALAGYVLLAMANSVISAFTRRVSLASVTLGVGWPVVVGGMFLLVSYGVARRTYQRKEFKE